MHKITAIILAVSLIFFALPLSARAAEDAPAATVLMEVRTGQILEAENAGSAHPLGTFAKLMTALLTAEALAAGRCTADTPVTAPAAVSDCTGAVIWLLPGEKMSVGELLSGLLIGNAGDAAVALACYLSGSEQRFVMDMNARAFELGLRDTRFASASGEGADAGVTTAHDLALLCRAVLGYGLLCERMSTWRAFLRGEATELVNENTLARSYEGLMGLKAAHGACGESIAAAAQRGDACYLAVALGCADADARFAAAKQLLGRGFSGYRLTTPAFADEFMRPLTVQHGTASAVELRVEGLRGLVLPHSNAESSTVVVLPVYLTAPVRAGQPVGVVAFYAGDTLVYEAPLVTAEAVPRLTWRDCFVRLLDKML